MSLRPIVRSGLAQPRVTDKIILFSAFTVVRPFIPGNEPPFDQRTLPPSLSNKILLFQRWYRWFLYQFGYFLLLEKIWLNLINPWHIDIIPTMIWHKSSYHWLLRLRTYEVVDWLYKRKFLQGNNIINFKLEGNIHLLKFLSVPCCWSWLTSLWHLLCNWLIRSELCVYLNMFHFLTLYTLLFSRILITSPCSESYILESWSP